MKVDDAYFLPRQSSVLVAWHDEVIVISNWKFGCEITGFHFSKDFMIRKKL